MPEEIQIVQIIIQMGAVGIAIYLIYANQKKDQLQESKDKRFMEYMQTQEKNFNDLVTNHLKSNSEMMAGVRETLKEVITLLRNHNNRK